MQDKIYHVLFICTGNSARSIMAEAVMNQLGQGAQGQRMHLAARQAAGAVGAKPALAEQGYPTAGLSSKPWEVFAGPDAPAMDFVFTVCDQAAGEACPVWPGQPMTAHWGFADPAAQVSDDPAQARKAFTAALAQITTRIRLFLSLPLDKLDRLSLQAHLRELGRPA